MSYHKISTSPERNWSTLTGYFALGCFTGMYGCRWPGWSTFAMVDNAKDLCVWEYGVAEKLSLAGR